MLNSQTNHPAIRMRGIYKTFGSVVANNGIDFKVKAGEIHTLLGENGAGKTTLMNILYGLVTPDEGEIYIHGELVKISSPKDAIALGVGMVHQQFMLVPPFTVVENVVLGLGTPDGPMLSVKDPIKKIQEISNTYGLRVNPKAEISQLSVGEQQRVEIIKALYRQVDILILDEPTAVLTPQEISQLFEILRNFVSEGHTVIFISHKLNEVLEISDQITVLRDGCVVDTVRSKDASKELLANMMVGREISLDFNEKRSPVGEIVLQLDEVWADNDKGIMGLCGVSLVVHAGEILGVAGVDGNGQRELTEVIVGLRKTTKGEIYLGEIEITNQTPYQAINQKIAFIPEDRVSSGILPDLTIWRNLMLGIHDQVPISKNGILNIQWIKSKAKNLIGEFDIRPPDQEWLAGSLSGGNQQKLILARGIDREPNLLIAAQPTRGLDIQTTENVRKRLLIERERGVAILLVSTDLQEILTLSDRILVLYEGWIMGTYKVNELTTEELGLLMAGVPI